MSAKPVLVLCASRSAGGLVCPVIFVVNPPRNGRVTVAHSLTGKSGKTHSGMALPIVIGCAMRQMSGAFLFQPPIE